MEKMVQVFISNLGEEEKKWLVIILSLFISLLLMAIFGQDEEKWIPVIYESVSTGEVRVISTHGNTRVATEGDFIRAIEHINVQ